MQDSRYSLLALARANTPCSWVKSVYTPGAPAFELPLKFAELVRSELRNFLSSVVCLLVDVFRYWFGLIPLVRKHLLCDRVLGGYTPDAPDIIYDRILQ